MTSPKQTPTAAAADAQKQLEGIRAVVRTYRDAVTKILETSDERHRDEMKKKLEDRS